MTERLIRTAVTLALISPVFSSVASAREAMLMRERDGIAPADAPGPCALASSTNGSCANYRWYNVCSGYIWIYPRADNGDGVGVLFGGAENPCVTPGNSIKRTITYFRNVSPGYNNVVHVYLDADVEGDGCPDYVLDSDLSVDPGLRWNCHGLDTVIPDGVNHVIIRTLIESTCPGPNFATDGPFTAECDPAGVPRSYYYGLYGSTCQPWTGPTSRHDNFLYWLVVDGEPTATRTSSWGSVKALYR